MKTDLLNTIQDLKGFEKVVKDNNQWIVTFVAADGARKAEKIFKALKIQTSPGTIGTILKINI